jgi:SOS-response transcriptional repressor LexA
MKKDFSNKAVLSIKLSADDRDAAEREQFSLRDTPEEAAALYEQRRQRLLEIRDELCAGKTASLARLIRKSDSYVTRMLWEPHREESRHIGIGMVIQIERALGWPAGAYDSDASVTDIVSGAFKRMTEGVTTGNIPASTTAAGPEVRRRIPLLDWAHAANPEKAMREAQEMLTAPFETSQGAYYLRVNGDSMRNPASEPSFSHNDLILIEPCNHAAPYSMVLVMQPGAKEPLFRQLQQDGAKSRLVALNPEWPDRFETMGPKDRVIGRVVSKTVMY